MLQSHSSSADPTKMTARRHILGLDLGQQQDFSAVCVLEDSETFLEPDGWTNFLAVRHLKRWPLKTKYPAIVADVAAMLKDPRLVEPLLVVDATGVGTAVCDLLDVADLGIPIRRVLITAGHQVNHDEVGVWHVPKKELVSVLQTLLQTKRLTVAKLPDRETLVRELLEFKVKISAALNEIYGSWRERAHDDLVLAVALACWTAESMPRSDAEPFSIPNLTFPEIIDRTRRLPGRNIYPF